MEDRELEVSNLQVRISMLHKQEQLWLAVLADASRGGDDQNKARQELRKVMTEILSDVAAIRKLKSQR